VVIDNKAKRDKRLDMSTALPIRLRDRASLAIITLITQNHADNVEALTHRSDRAAPHRLRLPTD